jgi:hypothetical protein
MWPGTWQAEAGRQPAGKECSADLLQLEDAGLCERAEQRLLAPHVHIRTALVHTADLGRMMSERIDALKHTGVRLLHAVSVGSDPPQYRGCAGCSPGNGAYHLVIQLDLSLALLQKLVESLVQLVSIREIHGTRKLVLLLLLLLLLAAGRGRRLCWCILDGCNEGG